MRNNGMGVMIEGLFIGIVLLLLYLFWQDRATKDPWTLKENALFGVGIGMALGGFLLTVLAGM